MLRALSVREFNEYFKTNIRHDPILSRVFVAGELTSIRRSGAHIYFSLKEDRDRIDCVIYNYLDKDIDFDFVEGVEVYVKGGLNLNNYSSRLVISVSSIEEKGLSEAYLAFIKMKEDFRARGYFDQANKKQISDYPKNVGLITSKDGAAVIDFLAVINQIPNDIGIILYPVRVQGDRAVAEIVDGINYLDKKEPDVIVITRGGGSSEDLATFNDRDVIEACFKAETPIISAIGHKIDNTLLDLVADLSLQTPTEAGSYIIRNYANIEAEIVKILSKMRDIITNQLRIRELELDAYRKSIKAHNPKNMMAIKEIDLISLKKNLDRQMAANISYLGQRLEVIGARLMASKAMIEASKKEIAVFDLEGKEVFSKYSLKAGDVINISFSDGSVRAEVVDG